MKNYQNNQFNCCTTVLVLSLIIILIGSCSEKNPPIDNSKFEIVQLPDVLTQIPSTDLKPLLAMIGDAKLIGVTEGNHLLNEPLDFRNEVIKFLVENKRIDVVAIESGIVESRHLFDYVDGKEGNIDSVLYNGISWTMDKIPQNRKLVEWLRNYNLDTANTHKVKMYGFDVPGSPANPFANRKMSTAINEALHYLEIVDRLKWEEFRNRLNPYIEYIHINEFDPNDNSKQYNQLTETERNDLTGIINDLIKLYELNEISYAKKSTVEDYQWAYRASIGSRQIDNWLRIMPLNYEIPSIDELVSSELIWIRTDRRDRSMADNIEWIKKREEDANILLFAHIGHLGKSTNTVTIQDSPKVFTGNGVGYYLAGRYGREYKVIGNYYLKRKNQDDSKQVDEDALANFLIHEDYENYYRLITEKDKEFLNKEWKYGEGILNIRRHMNPYQGVDIIFFNHTQTPVIIEN